MLNPEEVLKKFDFDSDEYVSLEQVRLAHEGYSSEIKDDVLIIDREDMAMPVFIARDSLSQSREVSKFLGED